MIHNRVYMIAKYSRNAIPIDTRGGSIGRRVDLSVDLFSRLRSGSSLVLSL